MADKKKYEKIVTPKGVASWIAVNKPMTNHNPDGEYSVSIVITAEEAKELLSRFEPIAKQALAEGMADPKIGKVAKTYEKVLSVREETDSEGEKTGRWIVSAKQKAKIKGKDGSIRTMSVTVVDAKKKPFVGNIGKGSTVRAICTIVPFCAKGLKKYGISLRLESVQVLDYVPYVASGNTDLFSEEEGFEGNDSAADTKPASESSDGTESDADFA